MWQVERIFIDIFLLFPDVSSKSKRKIKVQSKVFELVEFLFKNDVPERYIHTLSIYSV